MFKELCFVLELKGDKRAYFSCSSQVELNDWLNELDWRIVATSRCAASVRFHVTITWKFFSKKFTEIAKFCVDFQRGRTRAKEAAKKLFEVDETKSNSRSKCELNRENLFAKKLSHLYKKPGRHASAFIKSVF